jgi:LPS export ABC transporter protein LptC
LATSLIYREKLQLAAAVFAAGALSACEWPQKAPQSSPPLIVLSDVRVAHYRADGTRSDATLDRVEYRRDTGTFAAQALAARIPPGAGVGRGGIAVTAPEGRGELGKKSIHLQGGVVATTLAGDRLETIGARWDGIADRVVTDGPIDATGPGYHLTANTLEGSPSQENLRLGGGVKVHAGGPR